MQKTILIVDFEQESSEELQQILQSEEFLILTAVDGQQALSVFETAKPDLVLTEALLPKLNGFDLCKKITNGELQNVRPVIMYSAIYKGEKYQKEAVSGCGAAEFLDKPIPKWQLLKAVRSALSEPTPKKVADENTPKEVVVVPSTEALAVNPGHDSGDPLEIDALFDEPASTPVPEPAIANAPAAVVLETPPPDPKTPLMPSIDANEVDAALDAVRVDLHQERDDLLAREFEQNLRQSGQSILEFEASIANTAQMVPKEPESGEFELDEVLSQIASEPAVATADPTAAAAPNLGIKSSSSRGWLLPVLILVLLAVLAGVYFWFWG